MAKRKKRRTLPPPPSSPIVPGLVSPMRPVKAGIARPEYAATGMPSERGSEAVRTPDEIAAMRIAGALAAEALVEVGRHVEPGITTDELDRIGHEYMVNAGAYPSTLNYRGFQKAMCTSINEVICHGIPDSRKLIEGDILNIDITAFIEGVHGDTSAMFIVGETDPDSYKLIEVTNQAMHAGISIVRPGARIYEIGKAIESVVNPHGFGIVQEFIGHGIGTQFHTSLQIPHYYDPHNDTKLEEGMTFTVEPMINFGSHKLIMWDDGWTVTTRDLQRSAQFEHTVLVTADGFELLTVPSNGPAAETMFAAQSSTADS